MEPVDIYIGTSGLSTKVDPFTIAHSPSAIPLTECSNIDVTDNDKIRRRGGISPPVLGTTLGAFHSFFSSYHVLTFIEGDALTIMDKNGTVSRLAGVEAGVMMSFVEDNTGRIFFSNGNQHGFIHDSTAYNWVNPDPRGKVGPARFKKEYGPPPIGHLLGKFGAHTLVAADNYVFISEPFDSFSFNRDENYIPLDSPARVLREVTGGLWISTETRLMFFAGRDMRKLDPITMYPKPMVRGTDVEVPADELSTDVSRYKGIGIMVTAEDALLFLTNDGVVVNLSNEKIDIPPGATGSAVYYEGRYTTQINTI